MELKPFRCLPVPFAGIAAFPPVTVAAILILRHTTAPFFPMTAGKFPVLRNFKSPINEFLDYELLSMRAKHVKQFQTAPSEVARCRF